MEAKISNKNHCQLKEAPSLSGLIWGSCRHRERTGDRANLSTPVTFGKTTRKGTPGEEGAQQNRS